MSERLQIELDDIHKRFGVEPDADDIVELYKACQRVDEPYRHTNLALINMPVVVGGVPLWPLTIGASIWLDEYAFKWWSESNTLMRWALVFAFMRGRDKDVFGSLVDEKQAHRAIKNAVMRLACNEKELDDAIDILTGVKNAPKRETENHDDPDWERVIAELEVSSGISADQWLWGKSAAYTARVYYEHRQLLNYLAGNKTTATDALDDALTALALVKKGIWEKHHAQ